LQNLYEKALTDPKKTFKETLDFSNNHSNIPEINNLLTYLYLKQKKLRKAEKLTFKNYLTNPTNLLAKINYADQCIRKNKLSIIPDIFNNIPDLTLLYPKQKLFHASSYRGFHVAWGFYHHYKKNIDHAQCHHYLAYQIDSEHKSVIELSKRLIKKEKKLHSLVSKYFLKLLRSKSTD